MLPSVKLLPQLLPQKLAKWLKLWHKDAMPATTPARGPKKVTFGGKSVGMAVGAGDAAKWKKKADALFHLDGLQEETSNNLTSAMSLFVQRTSIVKEVCIPL
jgi:hypothetical protein